MVKRVRQFLENNKIFFEIFVASLLSFMAVYVSIQANRIAENQTRIMEEENLPQLEIRMNQEYNEAINIYDNNVWLIYNRGGKLTDIVVGKLSFIRLYKYKISRWEELTTLLKDTLI